MNPRVAEGLSRALRNKALLSAGIALLYGASPIDVIPDIIPVLGLVDDVIVVPAFLLLALLQYRRSRRVATTESVAGPARSNVRPDGPIIPGTVVSSSRRS